MTKFVLSVAVFCLASAACADDAKTVLDLRVVSKAGATLADRFCSQMTLENGVYRINLHERTRPIEHNEIPGQYQIDIEETTAKSVSKYVVTDFYCHGSNSLIDGIALGANVGLQFDPTVSENALVLILSDGKKAYFPDGSDGIFRKLP
jgi:hypothetical protein